MAGRGSSIGDVHFGVGLDDVDLDKQAKAAGDKAGTSLGKSITDSIKKSFTGEELGKGLVQGLGLAGALGAANLAAEGIGFVKDAITDTIGAAMDFEQGLRNVNSIAKVSEEELTAIGDAALEIGGKFGQSASTMVDALYDINSSGFAGAEALEVLESSALAATAGMATTGEAAAGITAVLNAYGLSAEDAAGVSDVLFKTVERGVVTFPQLSAEIGKTTALSAPLGVSLEEVGAALAVMTRAGIDAENATTQLNAIMASILKPSKEAADLAAQLGIDWSAAGLRANGLVGTLQKMIVATEGSEEQMATLLGDARAIRGAFSLAAREGAEFNEELGIMEDAAGSTAEAFSEQSKGTAFQVAQANARLEEAGIIIGQKFLPWLVRLADFTEDRVVPAIEAFGVALDVLGGKLPETQEGVESLTDLLNGINPATWVTGFGRGTDAVDQLGTHAAAVGKQVLSAAQSFTYMADASKDDLLVVEESAGDAADEVARIGTESETSLKTVNQSNAGILRSFQALRDAVAGGGAAVAAALYDPILAAAELAETQAELRAAREARREKGITAEQATELDTRIANLNKSLIEQNALILTYGTEAEQISKIKAFLTSDWWRQAYEDATPEQAAALDDWRETLVERLETMERNAADSGDDLREGWITELNQGAGKTRSAINTWSSAATEAFKVAQANARKWGYNLGEAYAAGLRASYGLVNDAANYVARGAVGPMKASSPPGPESPLHKIDVWGFNTGEAWAEGLASAAKSAHNASLVLAGSVAAGLTPGWSLASAVSMPSGALPPVTYATPTPAVVGARGGNEYHVHIDGLVKATDPFEIATQMERFQQTGVLPPPEDEYR